MSVFYYIIKKKYPGLLQIPEIAALFRQSRNAPSQDVEMGGGGGGEQQQISSSLGATNPSSNHAGSVLPTIFETVNEVLGQAGTSNSNTTSNTDSSFVNHIATAAAAAAAAAIDRRDGVA